MREENIPLPPEKPAPEDCCGGGCVPCVYDYYYDELDKWNDKYADNSKQKPTRE